MRPSKGKSRTFRRVYKRIPSGKTKIDYIKPIPKKLYCAGCPTELHGIPRKPLDKLSKTQKRPERPFGGVYCSKCSRQKIIQGARI